ncbi:protein of unknown function DUF1566 [Desulfurivibrio alkaliphilus AHT 2]|uniref:DUF1566 domain-containing protein n=2 Tax=Desulfurivibrio alkaliphilus TaxID=427923 RepID=D6YZT6_DESAT|nr:protein of unknown function DUF1566 [Desulfurivibrio alkaliphilus AHT 2]
MLLLLLLAGGCDQREEKVPAPEVPAETALEAEVALEEQTALETEPAPPPIPVEPVEFLLTYQAGEHGAIEGRARQQVPQGGSGSAVKAVADPGYHFTGWSDGLTTAARQEQEVTADLTVTAAFAPNRYPLQYEVEGAGEIVGESRQVVEYGQAGEAVRAVAAEDHHFVGWSDGVTAAGRQDIARGELTVRAVFAPNTYRIGGRVDGLVEGTELRLQNQDEQLIITTGGPFFFAEPHPTGTPYQITISRQPAAPSQTCTVREGHGVINRQEVNDIEVACVIDTFRIGGRLTGLPPGQKIVLHNNEADPLTLAGDGDFLFPTPLEDGSAYLISLQGPAPGDNWRCEVENASGVLAGRDVGEVEISCAIIPVLQARIGRNNIELTWNHEDFPGAAFNLCRAREEIPAAGAADCRAFAAGLAEPAVTSPHRAEALINDLTYWFQLAVRPVNGRTEYSDPISAAPFGGLNDTGIDWCADERNNHGREGIRADRVAGCEQLAAGHPDQDGHLGRDAAAQARLLPKRGSGSGGFDFTRVCASGEKAGEGRCPPNPALGDGPDNWACVRDNVTGLLWEVKNIGGRRGAGHTYSWYQPDGNGTQGYVGLADGGHCTGSDCDTAAYVELLNETGLCGTRQWRLPTRRELLSIVNNSRHDPAAETTFFPHTQADHYWTATTFADQPGSAWQVYFRYGESYPAAKEQSYHLRLVQGRTVTFGGAHPEFAPGAAQEFTYYDDGTVRHNITGLQWLRCSLGQTWDGQECTGQATALTWQEALQAAAAFEFAGHNDWRLPNKNELEALVATQRSLPAIRQEAFPGTPAQYFWTSSPYAVLGHAAWSVDFGSGTVNASIKSGKLPLRLVRDDW